MLTRHTASVSCLNGILPIRPLQMKGRAFRCRPPTHHENSVVGYLVKIIFVDRQMNRDAGEHNTAVQR